MANTLSVSAGSLTDSSTVDANGELPSSFVAIDFETADESPDSACAIGLVWVENGRIVRRERRLICPPRNHFVFTHIHGLTWDHVKNAQSFAEVWASLADRVAQAPVLVAHNAKFDRRVLETCCALAGIAAPTQPWLCTVALSRATWRFASAKLSVVCEGLGIDLDHHEPLSDATACARLVLTAQQTRAFLANAA